MNTKTMIKALACISALQCANVSTAVTQPVPGTLKKGSS